MKMQRQKAENNLIAYELYVDGTLKTEVVAFKGIKITDSYRFRGAQGVFGEKSVTVMKSNDDTLGCGDLVGSSEICSEYWQAGAYMA